MAEAVQRGPGRILGLGRDGLIRRVAQVLCTILDEFFELLLLAVVVFDQHLPACDQHVPRARSAVNAFRRLNVAPLLSQETQEIVILPVFGLDRRCLAADISENLAASRM